MRRLLFIAVQVLVYSFCNAQIEVSGILISAQNGEHVSDVQILSEDNHYLGRSNEEGEFSLNLDAKQTISFEHVRYESFNYRVENKVKDLIISLEPREILLSDATIKAKIPEVVYSNDNYHVADYEFNNEGIYILTYTRSRMFRKVSEAGQTILSDCQVVLLDENLNVQSKSVFFKDGVSLHLDSYGQLFLKCLNEIHYIYEENSKLLSLEMDKTEFHETIEPMVYGDGELKIYSNFDETFPEFSYYTQIGDETDAQVVYTVTDSVIMHMFRAQYRNLAPRDKLTAYRTELKTGIDKEIISGYMSGFHHNILFKPPYAPIFKTDSGYLIIDVINSTMKEFDNESNLVSSHAFNLHDKPRKNGWKNTITQDVNTNQLYVVYEKNGIGAVELIVNGDQHSGLEMKLFYKYPENVRIKDGYVYYLYRPFESSQKHFLYKEKITV